MEKEFERLQDEKRRIVTQLEDSEYFDRWLRREMATLEELYLLEIQQNERLNDCFSVGKDHCFFQELARKDQIRFVQVMEGMENSKELNREKQRKLEEQEILSIQKQQQLVEKGGTDHGEVQKQTRAITTLCQAADKKVNQLVSTVQGFDAAVGLEGTGFTAVKSYMSETYGALGKGLAMLAEATEQANRQYIEGYLSEVGCESLDSEELEREIQILNMIIATREASLQELLKRVEGKEDHHLQIIQGLQSSIYSSQEKQRKLEEKLQKLLAFEAKSSSYFEGIGELDYLVQSGLKAIGYNDGKLGLESWNGRRFARVDNSWIKKINQKWTAKEQAKMDVAIATLDGYEIEKIETGSKSIWKLKKMVSTWIKK